MPLLTAALTLCMVLAVGDGDSLSVRCGAGPRQQLRIAAIDAPELRQAWGQEARRHLAALCLRRTAQVRAQGHDKYGRTLAQVHCQGQDAAWAQVQAGLAWVHPSQARIHPALAAAARQARAQRRGLWVQKRPLAPWKYRQRRAGTRHGRG
ncbi:thermonuclease family protein [Comamonas sp. NLF-1-9]|uniref:thermonuclease family protein n=1 Tax=Comamonas sp. NLF-1-9 TaxID=2853163 RepID=UPI001C47FFE4|nr:thermonuclease family protein [Comamonas sp. NLF-1-9]QXL85621.1 thermonuclease family protein [Comamonas sp. NLF-1-9]